MALQQPDGEYITVDEITHDILMIRRHADAGHRKRYKEKTESRFERTIQDGVEFKGDLDSAIYKQDESILDNIKISGYTELKKLPEFKDAIDV